MEPVTLFLQTYHKAILSFFIAYLLGSFPTSYLIGKIFYKTDIRDSGSGNTGATNTLRTYGAKAGIVVLLIDVLKGILAVLIARYWLLSLPTENAYNLSVSLSCLAVIIGHIYSVFLKFKGGKGVATTAGVFVTILPSGFIYCIILFIFIVGMTKYVSLGSIISAIAFFFIELFSQQILGFPDVFRLALVGVAVLLILIKHKANFRRLMDGNENKISFKKKIRD